MSDYQSAVQAWLSGRTASASMPESFRMPRAFKRSPQQIAALDRVRDWTRVRFALPDDAAILVSEISCTVPDCPPLETVVAFWTDKGRHHFKIFKPVEQVAVDDLPPAFMRNALVVPEDLDCDCC